jgi:hypothetical protein
MSFDMFFGYFHEEGFYEATLRDAAYVLLSGA